MSDKEGQGRSRAKGNWWLHCDALNDDSNFHDRHIFAIHGVEEVSRPYQFDVGLAIPEKKIRGVVMLQNAWLQIAEGGAWNDAHQRRDDRIVHGVVGAVQSLGTTGELGLYRVAIVPRLWKLTLSRHSRIWDDTTVKKVIEEVLGSYGITPDFKLVEEQTKRPLICQFDETDFDFVSRWMEREGWYYWFQQPDEQGHNEKICITDSRNQLEYLFERGEAAQHGRPKGKPAVYTIARPNLAMSHGAVRLPGAEPLSFVHSKMSALPFDVEIRKTHPGEQPVSRTKAEVDGGDIHRSKRVNVALSNENIIGDEAGRLAVRRAQELACRRNVVEAVGTVQGLTSGHVARINTTKGGRRYLLTRVEHLYQSSGSMSKQVRERAMQRLQRVESGTRMALSSWLEADNQADSYQVAFECVPMPKSKDDHPPTEFRPARVTPIPRVHSMVRAKYAKGGRIVLDFDERSAHIRAPRELPPGMHFPIREHTRVLVKFADGDVDQPYVCGIAPDAVVKGPQGTERMGVLESQAGPSGRQNRLVMDDDAGSIALESSADARAFLKLGEVVDGQTSWNAKLFTEGTSLFSFGSHWNVKAGGQSVHHFDDAHEVVVGDATATSPSNAAYRRTVEKGRVTEVGGEKTVRVLRHEQTTTGRHALRVDGEHLMHAVSHQTTVGPAKDPEPEVPSGSHKWRHRTIVGEEHKEDGLHETTVNGDHKIAARTHYMKVAGPYKLVATSQSLSVASSTIEGDHMATALGTQSLSVRRAAGTNVLNSRVAAAQPLAASRVVDVEGCNWVRVGYPDTDATAPAALHLGTYTTDVNGSHWVRVGVGVHPNALLAPPSEYTVDVMGSIAARPSQDYLVQAGKDVSVNAIQGQVTMTSKRTDITALEELQLNSPQRIALTTDALDINISVCHVNSVLFVFS